MGCRSPKKKTNQIEQRRKRMEKPHNTKHSYIQHSHHESIHSRKSHGMRNANASNEHQWVVRNLVAKRKEKGAGMYIYNIHTDTDARTE